MKRLKLISNESNYVTELLYVCLYSNDISGITDDVNTINLCKRPMRYLFVKEQTVLLIIKVSSCSFISDVVTWSFFLVVNDATVREGFPTTEVVQCGHSYLCVM